MCLDKYLKQDLTGYKSLRCEILFWSCHCEANCSLRSLTPRYRALLLLYWLWLMWRHTPVRDTETETRTIVLFAEKWRILEDEFFNFLIRDYFRIKSLYKRSQDCVAHELVQYDCMNRLFVSSQWPLVELVTWHCSDLGHWDCRTRAQLHWLTLPRHCSGNNGQWCRLHHNTKPIMMG